MNIYKSNEVILKKRGQVGTAIYFDTATGKITQRKISHFSPNSAPKLFVEDLTHKWILYSNHKVVRDFYAEEYTPRKVAEYWLMRLHPNGTRLSWADARPYVVRRYGDEVADAYEKLFATLTEA